MLAEKLADNMAKAPFVKVCKEMGRDEAI